MATMNISLPDALKAFVEDQAAKEGFGTVSEYVRAVIREVQQREASRNEVRGKLLEATRSGPATPLTDADWEGVRQDVHRRHAQSRSFNESKQD